MQIGALNPYLVYGLILAAYVPGIIAILRMPKLALMPVITFTFLGMFIFTAVGSWFVITRSHFFYNSLLSNEYFGMLIGQAAIFYLIAGPYVWLSKPEPFNYKFVREDRILMAFLIILVIFILTWYHISVGKFLLYDLIAGHINRINILDYRALTWGLPNYPIFRLGFLVLPALIAAQAMLIISARGRLASIDGAIILACFIPILLPAEKAAALQMGVVVLISYCIHLGQSQKPLSSALNGKSIALALCILIPTIIFYFIYDRHYPSPTMLGDIVYRVVGSYSESAAAAVRYTMLNGFLKGATFPVGHGLFPHHYVDLNVLMHSFLAAGTEVKNSPLPGGTPIPANMEGYINFGWPGFFAFSALAATLAVAYQAIFSRLHMGVTSCALMAWYGYLGMTMSTASLFGTLGSFLQTILTLCVIFAWAIIYRILRGEFPSIFKRDPGIGKVK